MAEKVLDIKELKGEIQKIADDRQINLKRSYVNSIKRWFASFKTKIEEKKEDLKNKIAEKEANLQNRIEENKKEQQAILEQVQEKIKASEMSENDIYDVSKQIKKAEELEATIKHDEEKVGKVAKIEKAEYTILEIPNLGLKAKDSIVKFGSKQWATAVTAKNKFVDMYKNKYKNFLNKMINNLEERVRKIDGESTPEEEVILNQTPEAFDKDGKPIEIEVVQELKEELVKDEEEKIDEHFLDDLQEIKEEKVEEIIEQEEQVENIVEQNQEVQEELVKDEEEKIDENFLDDLQEIKEEKVEEIIEQEEVILNRTPSAFDKDGKPIEIEVVQELKEELAKDEEEKIDEHFLDDLQEIKEEKLEEIIEQEEEQVENIVEQNQEVQEENIIFEDVTNDDLGKVRTEEVDSVENNDTYDYDEDEDTMEFDKEFVEQVDSALKDYEKNQVTELDEVNEMPTLEDDILEGLERAIKSGNVEVLKQFRDLLSKQEDYEQTVSEVKMSK